MEGTTGVAEASATAEGDRLFEKDMNGIARPALDICVSNLARKAHSFLCSP